MKRLLTFALAILMVLSVTVTVSATEAVTTESGAASGNSSGDVIVDVNGWEAKYHVNVSWESLAFTCDAGWNPLSHLYDRGENITWTNETGAEKAKVTVTNHSNVDISYTAELENGGAVKNGVKAILEGADASGDGEYVYSAIAGILASGDGRSKEDADKVVFTVSVKGAITTSEKVTVDAVIIKIGKADSTASA